MVKFNDRRPPPEQINQLYFAVFQWRDPYIQQNNMVSSFSPDFIFLEKQYNRFCLSKQIVTANPWSSIAILSGVLLALFKAANFAKLAIQWIIRMRKRHLRNKERELNQVTGEWTSQTSNIFQQVPWLLFELCVVLCLMIWFCNKQWHYLHIQCRNTV